MNDDSSRRRFLALAAGGAMASAGCLGRLGSPDPMAMGEQGGDGDRTVTVSDPRVQRTFVYDNSVWREMRGEDGTQYLVVDVETAGFDRANVSLFDVAVDGEPLDADAQAVTGDAELADGLVAFPVPVAPADDAAVVWERTDRPDLRWRVPAAVVAEFARAPVFGVRDVTFAAGDGLGVAVENVGNRDGTFRLWISAPHADDVSHVAAWAVPAGETVTHRVPTGAMSFADPEGGVTFELDWGTGSTERTFEG